ncbi:MAG: electron transfer flavoprotein subunit alpha/FixB family protein [Acidobacteria bacterium]|nr:electron transfer flavoprotein subunit alpha/FixB family protein [Acidobacteriota bacterium]NIM62152.1 electron transfer flavoprotein subunit alpha/FixB family protein [Acidobacteriota bacterium]NIO59806.1 electron transfer flavoprotein subunit alpha/FixB family protein [Acidobacteriota bacterium]NIQ30889.1 electron transfer flavoprotein subunit alpha/FixB family protein [Acidobacteriota bacterium]NIQ85962.1 electron transfer flavoprotein subunit alpha/FixB family protein [Acidobacteriota ba
MGTILVFAECRDGAFKRSTHEAIGVARRIADGCSGGVSVVAIGAGAAGAAPGLAAYGADRVLCCAEEALDSYQGQAYAATIAAAADKESASLVLAPASAMGKDVAARLAARLDAASACDLTAIAWSPEDGLKGARPVYSGKAIVSLSVAGSTRTVATLRPNVFPAPAADDSREAATETIDCPLDRSGLRVRTVRVETPEEQELDVAEASIVVSGGRGLKEAANFSLVRDLASALGAAVGASRAVVDEGWIPHKHQVGQTGKVVSPQLYIACGISGAIQHLAGMSSSGTIVAINKDPEAPIFKVATYGIVGDLFEVLPALTQAVKDHTSS